MPLLRTLPNHAPGAKVILLAAAAMAAGVALWLFDQSRRTRADFADAPATPSDDRAAMSVESGAAVGAAGVRQEQPSPAAGEPPALERNHGTATERAHYESFLALARGGAGNLEPVAWSILTGPSQDCEKVAVLRAVFEIGSPDIARLFGTAIRALPDQSSPAGESVPSFAIGFLVKRAPRSALALSILEDVAFVDPTPIVGLRRRAAASLASAAPPDVLARLATHLARSSDESLVEGTLAALHDNAHTSAAEQVFWALGRPPPHR